MTHEEFEAIAALHALGVAAADEERDLLAHLEECAGCRRVLDDYSGVAASMALALAPVEPPGEIRDRVVSSIQRTQPEVVDITTERRRVPWWLATAATFFFALWGWREFQIRVSRERVNAQHAEIAQLRNENTRLAQQKDRLAAEIAAIASAQTQTISLSGQQASPQSSARVFMEPDKRRAIVFFYNLPENAGDKSYQLWIIRGDQPAPMSAGVFDVSRSGNASIVIENLPVATEIKALAVTLEPRGGVAQPTNTNFYLMGKS